MTMTRMVVRPMATARGLVARMIVARVIVARVIVARMSVRGVFVPVRRFRVCMLATHRVTSSHREV
jgi:hypothetical protein